jgi:hypothetical protein
LLLLGVALPVEAGDAQDKPRIDPFRAQRVDDRITVSFHVINGLSADMVERVRSGLPVTQRHRVEVLARRSVPLWPAKDVARMYIDTSAIYDSLTQRYALTREIRVGPKKKKGAVVSEESHGTDSIDVVRSWMTEFDVLPELELPVLQADTRLRVRVESTLGRRFVWYMFPGHHSATAEQRLDR